jgi:hypothetical protein
MILAQQLDVFGCARLFICLKFRESFRPGCHRPYFFFSPIFNVGAAAIGFGFSFFGFFASLFPCR